MIVNKHPALLNSTNIFGDNALLVSVCKNQPEIFRYLSFENMQLLPDSRDHFGNNSFIIAAANNYMEIIQEIAYLKKPELYHVKS